MDVMNLSLQPCRYSFNVRPLYARVVKDNLASQRVLQKCGFTICGENKGFANARGKEVEEFIMRLQ